MTHEKLLELNSLEGRLQDLEYEIKKTERAIQKARRLCYDSSSSEKYLKSLKEQLTKVQKEFEEA